MLSPCGGRRWRKEVNRKDLLGDSSEDPRHSAFGRKTLAGPCLHVSQGRASGQRLQASGADRGKDSHDPAIDRVQREVIDECNLSPDQKAGLWLFAWSFMNGTEQRLLARGYLAALEY